MKVAILGTGLIGGSVGLCLLRNVPGTEVVAFDADPEAARRAVARGAASSAASSAAEAVSDADLVVIATPVGATPAVAAEIRSSLRTGAVVTDVGSTKATVVSRCEELMPSGAFVGGHPMAGSESDGIEAARPDLFWGAPWILTPTPRSDPEAARRVAGFAESLGARVMTLTPEDHDELMAIVSHLPQILATSLMNFAAAAEQEHEGVLTLAAGGFRDVTRLAGSNPKIWVDICRDNAAAIGATLKSFSRDLAELGAAIEAGDEGAVGRAFGSGRDARRALPEKRGAGDLYEVRFPVPDRPGVLAEVTALIGDLGVNIEDLRISHVVEGTRGVLHVVVTGKDPAQRATVALGIKGYEAEVIQL